jgi:phosphopantothenoylcysteine decarboxylase/phosphopantothenate--cysteine ligase
MAKILLGITGSIAAVKIISLIHKLTQNGHECSVIVTHDGLNFVTPISIMAMGAKVFTDACDSNSSKVMEHINLAKWAEFILIVPCSANTIAKLAHGFADNLLLATVLASDVKPIIVPAMNQQMWKNQFTQNNITILNQMGIEFWGPVIGLQACGDNDIGRMLEVDAIYSKFEELHNDNSKKRSKLLHGLTLVITAGATSENIDPVRYITNRSSGKMGYAIAKEAVKYGAKVILISGNVSIEKPNGLMKFISITTADEMLYHCIENATNCDIFIGCAAVCDYKISNYSPQKIKKTHHPLTLDLIPNPDIIATIKNIYPNLFIVGFAAETENVVDNAIVKLKQKNLDIIIANDVSNGRVFDQNMNQVTLINKKLDKINTNYIKKDNLASLILEFIAINLTYNLKII